MREVPIQSLPTVGQNSVFCSSGRPVNQSNYMESFFRFYFVDLVLSSTTLLCSTLSLSLSLSLANWD